jgi:VCBS repeat-containing protein
MRSVTGRTVRCVCLLFLFLAPIVVGTLCPERAMATDYLYWADANVNAMKIGRANIDGTYMKTDFIVSQSIAAGVTSDSNYVYWTNYVDGTIGRANLEGTSPNQAWITGCHLPVGIAVDSNYVYWTNYSNGTIGRANLDGSGVVQDWIEECSGPVGIVVDGTYIYWTNYDSSALGRANLDGSNRAQEWVTGCSFPVGIAVDSTYVYWSNQNSDKLGRALLDGSGANQSWVSGANHPYGVAVDSSYVYWVNASGTTMSRANIDGSSPTYTWLSDVGSFVYLIHIGPGRDTPPTVAIGAPSAPLTAGGPVSYTVTYTGADTVSLADQDVSLNATGTASGQATVSGSGTATRTVTISNITGDGTLGISLAAGTAFHVDTPADAAGPSATFDVDNTAPALSLGAPSALLTQSGPITYTLTYTGADTITVSESDITVTNTGTANAAGLAVTNNGNATVTVTLSAITGDGTLAINVGPGTASDNAGNKAPVAGPGTAFTVDNTAPAVTLGEPSSSETVVGPVDFTVTYSGADTVNLLLNKVIIHATGTATAQPFLLNRTTGNPTVRLSKITGSGTLSISIKEGTAGDLAGNLAASAGPSLICTVQNAAPKARNDRCTARENTICSVPAPGLLENDTDANEDSLTAVVDQAPAHGKLTLNTDGSFVYIPDKDYRGADQFTYHASDGTVSSGTATVAINVRNVNDPPLANAGPDQRAQPSVPMVTLDGSNSKNPEGVIRTWLWEQTGGPAVTLKKATSAKATFTPPPLSKSGAALTFRLTVGDGKNTSSSDCIVNLANALLPPRAAGGPDQMVHAGDTVTLDGSGSLDPDGEIVRYHWIQTSGPPVVLKKAWTAVASFVAPQVGRDGSPLTFELWVIDKTSLMGRTRVLVNVLSECACPLADAGPLQKVSVGDTVTLNASSCADPAEGILSYQWSQLKGPFVSLSNPLEESPTFEAPDHGTLIFRLTVTNYHGLIAQSTCKVIVE